MNRSYGLRFSILFLLLIFISCATVPKEVVQLSYAIGDDLTAVHASYRTLVTSHFDGLRHQVNGFIDNEWKPEYLKKFIVKGDLVNRVKNPDPDKVLTAVSIWTEIAIKTIEDKRQSLLEPINTDEKALLESVDLAFNQLYKANATVTAHLNSIRKVKDQEDELLRALNLQDLRDKITQDLSIVSDRVNASIKEVKKVENQVESMNKTSKRGQQ